MTMTSSMSSPAEIVTPLWVAAQELVRIANQKLAPQKNHVTISTALTNIADANLNTSPKEDL